MISTKGRYALRLLLDLASQDSDEYIPLTLTLSTSGALYIAIDNKADIVDIEEEEDEGV